MSTQKSSRACGACAVVLVLVVAAALIGFLQVNFWFGEEHGKHVMWNVASDALYAEQKACIEAREDCSRLERVKAAVNLSRFGR